MRWFVDHLCSQFSSMVVRGKEKCGIELSEEVVARQRLGRAAYIHE